MPHAISLHLPDLLEPPLQDLHKPDANRLRRNLSGIINFAKFREEKLAPYTDMQEAAEHLLEETAQLEEQQLQLVGGWLGPTAGRLRCWQSCICCEPGCKSRRHLHANNACKAQHGRLDGKGTLLQCCRQAVAWHAMSAVCISPPSCLKEACCVCLQQAELQRLREEREAQQPVRQRTACMCSVRLAAFHTTCCHSAAQLSLT